MRKLIFLLFCLCFYVTDSMAQSKTISGKVSDAKDGSPLSGVSVTVKNGAVGVKTDAGGNYNISVNSERQVLVFSFVGYQTRQNAIGRSQTLDVVLTADNANLQDVVVVAYGTQRKTNVTGSVSTVNGADLENKPFSSVDKALQGSVAGLQSTSTSGAPGSATDIRIRGIGSITASSSPLWVIDGVIATTGDLSSNSTTANALSSINPDDIESISVLKDAAATSVYGSRAANGVIIVTTKKGKSGQTHLNFSTEVGQNSIGYMPSNKPLTSLQSQTVLRQSLINAGYATDNASADALIIDPVNGLGIDSNYTKTNTNWLDQVTRKGNQSQYNLSLSGGDPKTQFYASAGYFKQQGISIATDFNRYNGSLSITHKATDKVTFTAGINGSTSSQTTPSNGGTFANPILASFFLLPWYSPYNADGSYRYNDAAGEFPLGGGVFNPVIQAAWNNNTLKQTTLRGNVSGEYKILDNLKFTSRYSAEYFDVQEDSYRNPFYGDGYAQGGDAFAVYTKVFDYTWSNFFDFKQNLNKEKDIYFDLKAGYEAQQRKNYLLEAGGQAFPQTLALQYLASAATPTTAYSLPSGNSTTSIFSVADINYKDRYVVSGSFRRDGASVFGASHRWGNFYSVGGTWNANEEDFLKDMKAINLLKLRASYGQNGNSIGFGNYTSLPTYGYGNNYTGQPGSAINNVGNPDLTWEKNGAFNLGLDFGLWKNRFYGTVEYYDRKTSNLLLNVALSPTAGVTGQVRNVGAMENKGIEITLGGKPIVTKNFSWDVSFNFAHNKNKVTELYLGNPIPYSGNATTNGNFEITVGHDIYELYLRQWAGVNPADGTPLWYTDSSHTTTTGTYSNAKLGLIGKSALPKFFGSFTNTFTYKAFSLSAQLYYNFGNYLEDSWGSYTSSEGAYLGSFNQLSNELNSWKKPGDITNVPQVIFGGNNNSYRFSTRFLYKGDYVRLRDVQLNYTVPKSLMKKAHISNVTLYVRGTNLLTWVKDKNLPFDPEEGITSTGNLNIFIPKTISGGVKIGL